MTNLPIHGLRPYSVDPVRTESLPFRVRLANTDHDLHRLVQLRAAAYGRHVPGMERVLAQPEEDDFRPDVALILAECKTTGEVLGSMRLVTNFQHPLHIETEIELPALFTARNLMEAWRLTVRPGPAGKMVTAALYKVLYEVGYAADVDHVLVVARRPVDRLYQSMQFKEALAGRKIALSNTLGLPHSLYHLPVKDADRLWRQAQCALYPFMAMTVHPDLEVHHHEVTQRFFAAAYAEDRL